MYLLITARAIRARLHVCCRDIFKLVITARMSEDFSPTKVRPPGGTHLKDHTRTLMGFFIAVVAVGLPVLSASAISRAGSPFPLVMSTVPALGGNPPESREGLFQRKEAVEVSGSGLEGVTQSKTMGGLPEGSPVIRRVSIEFAIAPIENEKPSYSRSVVVKSDGQGNFKISLPPGRYWVGPKGKAMDPAKYVPGPVSVSENVVVVEKGSFTKIDVFELEFAP